MVIESQIKTFSLLTAGFNYYGEDVLYSGTDGRMLDVQIFEGIIYYQRLRHMTADKWQVSVAFGSRLFICW